MDHRLVALVVEDHPGVRDTLEQMVESWARVDLLTANGFLGACTWITAAPAIDLLICDVDLPGEMTGIDLAEIAVKTFPGIAVVMISGFAQSEVPGFIDRYTFVRKPFSRWELLEHIDNAYMKLNVIHRTQAKVDALL